MILGCDLHTRYQQVAMLDTDTGELDGWPILNFVIEGGPFKPGVGLSGDAHTSQLCHPDRSRSSRTQ